MFGSNPKRHRTSRAAVRGPETVWSRLLLRLRDRDTLVRLGICLLASVALLVLLKSWRAPFPYRTGQYAADGIAAKIDFERVDEEATKKLQERAESEVPRIFHNDPERLDTLPQKLRAALGEIAQAESLNDVRPETARDFGLRSTRQLHFRESALYAASSPPERFDRLKQALGSTEMGTSQTNIDTMVDEFSKFIAPLKKYGRISENDEDDLDAGQKLLVLSSDGSQQTEVLVSQVRLSDQLNDAGDLGGKWLSYPSLTLEIRPALSHWLSENAEPTLVRDQAAYAEARNAALAQVPVQMEQKNVGDLLVRPGQSISDEELELLSDEYLAMEAGVSMRERAARMATVLALILVLGGLNGYYIVNNEPRLARSLSRLAVYLIALVVAAVLGRALTFLSWPVEVIPILATAMILAVAYNPVLAILSGFTICVIVTLSSTSDFAQFNILMSTTATAVVPLHRVASRSKIVLVGIGSAACYLAVSLGIGILQTQSISELLIHSTLIGQSLRGAALCVVTGYLVAGSLPFIESAFGVVTDISLLELSDPSHPLLQELVRRAPGTYNHSISVGSIAEAAAESIGANGLLVRVGAYFHDIGKMLKPQYFIENMQEGVENRHSHLAPAMSTLIIIGHVKDGVDLAEQHNLPQAMLDFIEQHHGTTLVEYFYHEATKLVECQPDHRTDAEESSFRYPGPKPQSREAGVLMLADAVESASRTLSDPTPKRIESLVHNITLKRLLDGQFDDCSLRLSDIRTIEESLVKSLIAVYHGRIRYPDAQAG
jgi:cyclic-di-AMP phosphodiesterase PgpH